MKKIERLDLREENITSGSQDAAIAMRLNELIDSYNELLETHTVKEEECDCNGMHEGNCPDPRFERKEEPIEHERHKEECCENLCHCDNDAIGHFTGVEGCHKEELKEEPTTTEKKCCKNCGLDYQDPIYCSIFGRSADKHEWI